MVKNKIDIMKKVNKDTKQTFQIIILLIVLSAIIQVTGTTFFGVNLLPWITLVIVVALLIVGYQSDNETIKWIRNKLKMIIK